MPIASIHDWLQRRGPFDAGVDLLKLHGEPTRAELFLFSLPESPATREKLEQLLRVLNDTATEAVQQQHAATVAVPHPARTATEAMADPVMQASLSNEGPRNIEEHQLPHELRPLRRDLTAMHKQMTVLRGIMVKTPDGMELRQIAEDVDALDERIARGWEEIEYWRKTGTLLRRHAPERPDHAGLLKEERRLSVWLSQRRNGHRTSPPEDIAAKEARLKAVRAQLRKHAS